MDREQKCGIRIVDSLMLERYMLVLSLRAREMALGFAPTWMAVNMQEVGKIMCATVREPLITLMVPQRRDFSKMVR